MQQTALFDEAQSDASLLDLDWEARRARVLARFEAGVGVIEREVLSAGYTPRVAFSGGKDSLTTLILVCEALRRRQAAGATVPTLHVTSANTRVENPAVLDLISGDHAAVRQWGATHGISVDCEMVGPGLSSDLWVQVIGGRSLPPHRALKRTNCSTDWKVRPSARATARINRALKAQGKKESVTLLGTRFDESDQRSKRMRMRGESSEKVRTGSVGSTEYLTLSPIAEWSQEEVFAFLQGVGDGWVESFRPNHNETLALYNDAAGFGCVLVPDPNTVNRASSCGGRFGCYACLIVSDDRSMRNMTLLTEHEPLKPLHAVRDILDRVSMDMRRRATRITNVDLAEGTCKVEPRGRLDARTREALLRLLLSVQAEENIRAEGAGEAPRFSLISEDQLIAIDYLWAVDGGHAPHAGLAIWRSVERGDRLLPADWPDEVAALEARPASATTQRIPAALLRGIDLPDDPLALTGADTQAVWWRHDEDAFTVDAEGAACVLAYEADDWLDGARHGSCGQAEASYLSIGVVAHPRGQAGARVRSRVRRGLYAGLEGLESCPDRRTGQFDLV